MKYCLFLVLAGLIFSSWDHPLKITFSQMKVDKGGVATVYTKIFLDDLTNHLKNKYRLGELDFENSEDKANKYLQEYLKQNLYFIQEGKKNYLLIEKAEITKDGIALQITLKPQIRLDKKKDIKLRNSLFLDAFRNQINHLVCNKKQYIFDRFTKEMKIKI